MKLEAGSYFVAVPQRERNTDGSVVMKLVALPALCLRRRQSEVERETEKMVVSTKLNRRGKEIQKATREKVKETHEVCDIALLLHELNEEQTIAAEVAGLTRFLGMTSNHEGVYELEKDDPADRRFKSSSKPSGTMAAPSALPKPPVVKPPAS